MSYDPCGTQRLDGDEILRRLAKEMNVKPLELRNALNILLVKVMEKHEKL